MKGLSFSEPMVKAWMKGRKTVTRRLMNPQPDYISPIDHKPRLECGNAQGFVEIKPRYLPGETVYIKEVWGCEDAAAAQDAMSRGQGLFYRAGMAEWELATFKRRFWRSPRFMPEWAARSHALIVSVRPERVQEITREDAHNEGFWPGMNGLESWDGKPYGNAQLAFQACWETLHPGSWERNDFVFRYELKKV